MTDIPTRNDRVLHLFFEYLPIQYQLHQVFPILGPILFLIYINDFPEYLSHSKLRLFAYDSIIYRDIKTQDDCIKLQQDLDSAARWEADWLMAFHPDKCTKLSFPKKTTNPAQLYSPQPHPRIRNICKIPWHHFTIKLKKEPTL